MITLKNICAGYIKPRKNFFGKSTCKPVLSSLYLDIEKGCCLGILGESGSGKTTLVRVLCGLLKPFSGEIKLKGQVTSDLRSIVGKIGVVFQDYQASVNPKMLIREIIQEAYLARNTKYAIQEVLEIFSQLGIEAECLERYPHEVSGGQLQRICIARAVLLQPEIIIFDEVTSALDTVTQIQILDLIKTIKSEFKVTCIFITHDILAAVYCCDQLVILNQGKIVEHVKSMSQLGAIQDGYSCRLLDSIKSLEKYNLPS